MKPNLQESFIQPNSGSASLRRNTCLPPSMNRAFTLIELLVVIAIISILASLLLPTLQMAKNRAMASVDLNNVHQILLATHIYCTDNDDLMPQPGWGESTETYGVGTQPSWASGVGFTTTPTPCGATTYSAKYVAQVNSFKGTKPTYTKSSQLYPYLGNPKVLRCPNDVPGPGMYQRANVLTSYVFNGAVNGYPCPSVYGATRKLGRFRADDILLWENDEKYGYWNDLANKPTEGISARHGKGATVGLFGGAALRMDLAEFQRLANETGKKNRLWCNPNSSTGHGDSCYQ